MDAGRMDRRIAIVRETETGRNAFNEPIVSTTETTVWASKEDIRDGERWTAQEVGAEVTTRFRIRWSATFADLDPQASITFDGRAYNVVSTKEIGRREGIEITANARAD